MALAKSHTRMATHTRVNGKATKNMVWAYITRQRRALQDSVSTTVILLFDGQIAD